MRRTSMRRTSMRRTSMRRTSMRRTSCIRYKHTFSSSPLPPSKRSSQHAKQLMQAVKSSQAPELSPAQLSPLETLSPAQSSSETPSSAQSSSSETSFPPERSSCTQTSSLKTTPTQSSRSTSSSSSNKLNIQRLSPSKESEEKWVNVEIAHEPDTTTQSHTMDNIQTISDVFSNNEEESGDIDEHVPYLSIRPQFSPISRTFNEAESDRINDYNSFMSTTPPLTPGRPSVPRSYLTPESEIGEYTIDAIEAMITYRPTDYSLYSGFSPVYTYNEDNSSSSHDSDRESREDHDLAANQDSNHETNEKEDQLFSRSSNTEQIVNTVHSELVKKSEEGIISTDRSPNSDIMNDLKSSENDDCKKKKE
ncbi:hypothetical protein GJ496_002119 [Pomphorhynchus laevis]|nr:hypothetical protein GJ496_002119 [Pomphorhynchus laevis]